MRLRFLGAAGEVTGSSYLVEMEGCRFLVDCGLFQGGADADRKNLAAFDFDVRTLDFVVLTHAHLDHTGLLPRLVGRGYRGPVYTSSATAGLLPTMLRDSAYIQEKEAGWANGDAAGEPLYTVAQAEASVRQLQGIDYETRFAPHPHVRLCLRDAGHVLGSAIVELWIREGQRQTKLVFSGDLGQPNRPLVRDPTPIQEADVLLVESTYGNRNHRSMDDTIEELVDAIQSTFKRGGNLIVPAFALGRTQDLLVLLAELAYTGRLRDLQVYVDSPLATAATQVTLKHADVLDEQAKRLFGAAVRGELPLHIHFTESVEDSKSLNAIREGIIIIAASGMCDAGRIKHHLVQHLGRSESGILFTGYQAQGSLGRRIIDGAASVRIFREDIPVRAQLHTLGGLSAHADQGALLDWLKHYERAPQHCYVVHGEADIAKRFADVIRSQLGWQAVVPTQHMVAEFE